MEALCPAPGPEDPFVRGLLSTVDCHVQTLVRSGYGALFEPSSPFASALTSLLVIFVALTGYQLLLGRAQLRVGDLALTLVKLGVVLALTTQWTTYQSVVYQFLFRGPQDLASVMVGGVQPGGADPLGVFDGLQQTFDAMVAFSALYAGQAPPAASPLLGGAGSGALALTASAVLLLLASLGVLLAAKIVLGVLLAVGPIFIALLLFDSTRGLFEGWLRATLAFAFAPLSATLLLGVALLMLQPSLQQLQDLTAAGTYALGPVYGLLILVLVFAGVSLGVIVASGLIFSGLKLPRARSAPPTPETLAAPGQTGVTTVELTRAGRVAAAASALDRRDTVLTGAGARSVLSAPVAYAEPATGESRRSATIVERDSRTSSPEPRLGQGPRRNIRPRAIRTSARSRR